MRKTVLVVVTLTLAYCLITNLIPSNFVAVAQVRSNYKKNAQVELNTDYFAVSPGNPFQQNWTNTGLLTANDDWAGVPSVIGYLGEDPATTTTAVDPQTITGEGTLAIDVIANQSNPNTLTNGGAAEFEITDPVVALQGSGTADFPYVDLRLNTVSCSSPANTLKIEYLIRDIDGSVDNAVQQVALQYRVGATGTYTNVPAGYVADATTGPSLATQVTPISQTLSPDVQGQAQVHVRILTTNAIGSDEWIGVDDINVTCNAVGGNPGTLSINTAGNVVDEGAGSIAIAVNRTGGTDGTVSVNYTVPAPTSFISDTVSTEGESVPATGGTDCLTPGVDFINTSGTLTFVNGDASETINITICDDAVFEPTELFTAEISNPTGGATIGQASANVGIINNDAQPPASIGGRVVDASGRGIAKTRVELYSNGVPLEGAGVLVGIANTSTFGYFGFSSLPTGATYTVVVGAKRYAFTPNSQTFQLNSDNLGVNFTANP